MASFLEPNTPLHCRLTRFHNEINIMSVGVSTLSLAVHYYTRNERIGAAYSPVH
jgi:hypothetical protein